MDKIQKVLVKIGRKDLAQEYYLKIAKKEKVWVYETRTKKWYLVGSEDRDYSAGISQTEFKELGKQKAKEKYLRAIRI